MTSNSPLLIAQITDTHLFADADRTMKGCPTAASLQAVLQHLQQQTPKPDLLLMTGDLSQDETIASYEHLRDRVTALKIPAYWIPGNHDQAIADMAAVLDTDLISPDKALHQGGWNIILLDSSLPQQVQGAIAPASLQWLDQQLRAAPTAPALIALHHPPLPIHSEWMDAISLENSEEFLAVLDNHPQVKLVIFGHIHQEFDQWRNGVRYLGTPSTCIQFAPLLATMGISDEYPGYRMLKLFPDGDHATQVERVPFQFAEPSAEA